MNKIFLFNTMLMILFLIGCNDDDNPAVSSDQMLERNLVGKWGKSGYTITFNSDYTFADSTLDIVFIDSSYTQVDTVKRSGKYFIKDGILYMTDIYFSYVGTNLSGMSYAAPEIEISLMNNKLSMRSIYIFNSNGTNNVDLYGSWKREVWYCNYFNRDSIYFTNGKKEENYNFFADSSKCNYRVKYLTGLFNPNEYIYNVDFTYQKSTLNIPAFAHYNVNIQFRTNKMIWYFNTPITELTKM